MSDLAAVGSAAFQSFAINLPPLILSENSEANQTAGSIIIEGSNRFPSAPFLFLLGGNRSVSVAPQAIEHLL